MGHNRHTEGQPNDVSAAQLKDLSAVPVHHPTTAPLISVVLSAYNAEKYIYAAIASILEQTFTDLELIIINDGSTDRTLDVIKSFTDHRIQLISRENRGLIASLNQGFECARGIYIARMDADDIALPDRLRAQYEFMEKNPEVGVVGSFAEVFGDQVRKSIFSQPMHHRDIIVKLFMDSSFIHPSVMIRSSVIGDEPFYSPDYVRVEDYAAWVRLAPHTTFANLPQVLLKYRIVETSETRLSQKNNLQRHHSLLKVHRLLMETYQVELTPEELTQYTYSMYRPNMDQVDLGILKVAYDKINAKCRCRRLKEQLAIRWIAVIGLYLKSLITHPREVLFSRYSYLGLYALLFKKRL